MQVDSRWRYSLRNPSVNQMEGVPPKFAPFKKTRVVLALEDTPMPIDQKTDLTAHVEKPFRAEGVGSGGDEDADAAAQIEPMMFSKKQKREGVAEARATRLSKIAETDAALPDFLRRAKVAEDKKRAPGARATARAGIEAAAGPTIFSRTDAASREQQAELVAKLPQELQDKAKILLDVEAEIPYEIEPAPEAFTPMTRRGFGSFIIDEYSPIFPTKEERKLDVATCAKKGEEGKKEVKI